MNTTNICACSNSTWQTLEDVKLFKIKKDTRTLLMTSFWCFYCYFWTISHLFLVFLLLTLIKKKFFLENVRSFAENIRSVKIVCPLARTISSQKNSLGQHLNPFHATDLFWYPLKTSENLRGYQKRSVAWNGLIKQNLIWRRFRLHIQKQLPEVFCRKR